VDLKKLDNQTFIAVAIIMAFICVILAYIFCPPKNVDQAVLAVVNMLIGALISNTNTVISFFFGSSKGSKDKDDTISEVAKASVTPPLAAPVPQAGNAPAGQ